MICEQTVKKFCEGDFTKIENYNKAIVDSTTWDCHHRLETHNSDGERRLVDLTSKELIALGMYYDRPPEELIFMTSLDHHRLHRTGKHLSEETRRKLSEVNKGKKRSEEARKKASEALKGRKLSEEDKRKKSKTLKGHPVSEETRKRMSEAQKGQRKGMHWKLVDGKRVWY